MVAVVWRALCGVCCYLLWCERVGGVNCLVLWYVRDLLLMCFPWSWLYGVLQCAVVMFVLSSMSCLLLFVVVLLMCVYVPFVCCRCVLVWGVMCGIGCASVVVCIVVCCC